MNDMTQDEAIDQLRAAWPAWRFYSGDGYMARLSGLIGDHYLNGLHIDAEGRRAWQDLCSGKVRHLPWPPMDEGDAIVGVHRFEGDDVPPWAPHIFIQFKGVHGCETWDRALVYVTDYLRVADLAIKESRSAGKPLNYWDVMPSIDLLSPSDDKP